MWRIDILLLTLWCLNRKARGHFPMHFHFSYIFIQTKPKFVHFMLTLPWFILVIHIVDPVIFVVVIVVQFHFTECNCRMITISNFTSRQLEYATFSFTGSHLALRLIQYVLGIMHLVCFWRIFSWTIFNQVTSISMTWSIWCAIVYSI